MSRFGYVMATYFATMGVAIAAFLPLPLKFIWNASASAPLGLYAIDSDELPQTADLLAVDAPEPLATFLAERGYLPHGVPLMKRVAGVAGQRVCRAGRTISVDGIDMAEALDRDRLGRALPSWQGCRVIAVGEIFLMNWQVRDSLDGRYFGPVSTDTIIGRATPLYTDEGGNGRFEWRAPTR
ncbi:S26 family signal peptidase [Mesorhizobium sp. M8A.F.Ca.ET.208.01.1.1]|uniref:S26 family signal peptidase n=1 Tax=unclassified Mesorhizobium TaxID=325217 RepID=UPI001093F787|nr:MULTISPECIES: S26 family signal peptidase [unclassified Mesorhizobium]TGQ94561.1 S26 family signal peptidase [Mesorhizobium sp. M8A.F.Ca.ET.208.01.1.1]TGT55049.1 S26 family signal peptidase [Mesorhizobium sp. M8A.F.Ca.ET.167.01.1.1]